MSSRPTYEECLQAIPVSYATCSIGQTTDPLPKKLNALAGAGFQGIELSFPDLLEFAKRHLDKDVGEQDYPDLCEAAAEVKRICNGLDLKIMMLQPFSNFEGWPRGSRESEDAFERAAGWINIMKAAGTDLLQVGSSDSPNITSNKKQIAQDLADLCNLLAEHGFRLAYENWCWATHAPKWSDVWEIAQLANKPNIGLCLDTFQTAGGEYGDPTTESGVIESVPITELENQFRASLLGLSMLPPDKIYLLQISDAYKPPTPLEASADESGMRPRGRWSQAFRPMPYDGGYLPIQLVTGAVLASGFRGWFSMEIFDGGADGKGNGVTDLDAYAKKAMDSYKELLRRSTIRPDQ